MEFAESYGEKKRFAEEGDGFFRRENGHGVFFILVVDPCFPLLSVGGGHGGNIKWVDEMNGICCERFGWVLLIEQCRLACTRRERPQEAADILWLRGRAPPPGNNRLIKLSWTDGTIPPASCNISNHFAELSLYLSCFLMDQLIENIRSRLRWCDT